MIGASAQGMDRCGRAEPSIGARMGSPVDLHHLLGIDSGVALRRVLDSKGVDPGRALGCGAGADARIACSSGGLTVPGAE